MDGGEESAGLKRRRPSGGAYGNQATGASPMPPGDSTSSLGSNETSQKSKKRFVWPDDLHREFVAAIFDVGLKCASPKSILTMMKNSREVTSEHIRSHLQKYRVHRERAREEFVRNLGRGQDNSSRMEADMEGRESKPVLGGLRESPENQALILAGRERMRLQGPLTPMSIITECLEVQLGFQAMLKQALGAQQHIQSQLQAHFHAMGMTADAPVTGRLSRHGGQLTGMATDPSTASTSPPPALYSSGAPPGHHHHYPPHSSIQPQSSSTPATAWEDPHGHGLAASAKMGAHHHHEDLSSHGNGMPIADSLRTKKSTELQMEAEMRSHMDMHRQLLIRKKDQVSQYCAGDVPNQQPPPPATVSHSLDVDVDLSSFKWNDECLDEDLFNFLRGDDGI